ncbi:hypothetical protein Tco_1484859 [Tanacetum coccineum]
MVDLIQVVLNLQKTKDAPAAEIFKLKKRIKKLEKKSYGMDYMETKEAVNERRQSNKTEELNLNVDTKVIDEDKGSGEKGGSTVSTARPEVSTAGPEVDTARPDVDAARQEMKEEKANEKGVAFKDVEDSLRPARSVLTLKPLPSIDPKEKGKGILVEEEPVKIKRKDQGIDQIERNEELAHKLHEEELAEIARIQEEKVAQKEASRVAIMEMFDEVQAGIDVDALFAAKLQQEERECYKHSQLKAKTFEEIQGMCERQKKKIDDFKPIDSDDAVKDSKKAAGEDSSKKEEVLKEPDSTKVEVKLEEAEQGTKKNPSKTVKMKARKKARKQTHADIDNEHDFEEDEKKIESMNKEDSRESSEKVLDVSKKRKRGPRMKRMSERKKTKSDLEEEEDLKTFLKIVPDKEGIIDYEVLERRFPIIKWESKFYHYDRHGAEGIYYRIFRSDGSSRWIKTFSKMATMFDRLDLVELYNLVMQRFEKTTPEGNYGVHTLTLEDGTEIHMLVERKYPLTKETLERMMSLKLIAESASNGAYDLLRFIQKQIDKARSYDGGDKDL